MRPDLRVDHDAVVAAVSDGMTVGIGGWGSRRKPMSLVRALCRSEVRDLTLVTYGGPDVGLACATGTASRVVYGFVSLDSIPLEPHFRRARQEGTVAATEYGEGMVYFGLFAAANRLPFLPLRAGLGSSVMDVNPQLETVTSPYAAGGGDGEFVAMPALELDVALIHVNRADAHGNGAFLGPDPYFDDLFCQAAETAWVSCERIVDTAELTGAGRLPRARVNRALVDGVVEAPGGAHFTSCPPDYGRDEDFQRAYAATAGDPDAWAAFRERYLDVGEDAYQRAVRERDGS